MEKQPQVISKVEQGFALGTTYLIRYEVENDSIDLLKDIEEVFNVVNKSMSTYLPTSDISRINKGDSTVVVDEYFIEVFKKAKEVWKNSGGRFDPTVGALVNAWGFGPEKALKEMHQKQVDSILKFTGFDKVKIDDGFKIVKSNLQIYLDFNALAKGYTIDLIGRKFDEKGIKNYLIEVGGEILTKGKNSKTVKNWIVAIDHPLQNEGERLIVEKVKLEDKAMATSGNYRKFRVDEKTGEHYVHTINPLTGYPQKSNVLSVSVIANSCMEADAYATALMVMPLKEAKELLKNLDYLDAYIISTDKDGNLEEYRTRRFQDLLVD
ncbi:FAD:protein FMN transferase [Abyssalbus ytuae]|uniref:FAD:protein FMN transferase n=1 Tax=Abyssalbus ytuae TaxID=2926907 RepID=A0A9E7D0E6_9FLAO|nr:FAD:protein FMN transferase [Abyssalbus ytuae]UOB18355.1 FAD:protein FMN transferase [Abyssalbus ytuae]